jgi:G3E family GTPase
MTFTDPGLRDRIRLDSVTCVVDADQVFAHPEYPPLLDLKLRQVGSADMLILNKVSLAGPAQVAKVRARLDGHFQPSSHRRDRLLPGALLDPAGRRALRSRPGGPQLTRRRA